VLAVLADFGAVNMSLDRVGDTVRVVDLDLVAPGLLGEPAGVGDTDCDTVVAESEMDFKFEADMLIEGDTLALAETATVDVTLTAGDSDERDDGLFVADAATDAETDIETLPVMLASALPVALNDNELEGLAVVSLPVR
jgi:hypothetical protein